MKAVLFFGIVLFAVCAILGVSDYVQEKRRSGWAKVEGRIRSCGVNVLSAPSVGTRIYHYDYAYTVQGVDYRGRDQISRRQAEKGSAPQRIVVYFNPENPMESVLWREKRLGVGIFGMLTTGLGLWAFFAVIAVLSAYRSCVNDKSMDEVNSALEIERIRALGKKGSTFDFLLVMTSALGMCMLLALQPWESGDQIFGQDIGFYGKFMVGYISMLIVAIRFSRDRVVWPPTRRQCAYVIVTMSLVSVAHVANAYAYWGDGMSHSACFGGLVMRIFNFFGISAAVAFLPLNVLALAGCGWFESLRTELSHYRSSPAQAAYNVVMLFAWITLLSLLVYEILIQVAFSGGAR